jgi:hypothetical protein
MEGSRKKAGLVWGQNGRDGTFLEIRPDGHPRKKGRMSRRQISRNAERFPEITILKNVICGDMVRISSFFQKKVDHFQKSPCRMCRRLVWQILKISRKFPDFSHNFLPRQIF